VVETAIVAITQGTHGVHLEEVPVIPQYDGTMAPAEFAWGTLCGLNNIGREGNDYGPFGNIRGPGWHVVKTTEVTCRACYEKGKELSGA
jgi:hypothetical protein